MRLGSVAALLLLSCLLSLPAAMAQAPPLPPAPADPGEALALACAAVGQVDPSVRDALPVCDQPDPAAPVPGEEEGHAHEEPAAAPVPAAPEDAQDLADEIAEDAQAIPEDPAGAPERLMSILATVVQFVRDLIGGILGAPLQLLRNAGAGLEAIGGGIGVVAKGAASAIGDAAAAIGDGAKGAADATRQALADLGAKVSALLDALKPGDAAGAPAQGRDAVADAQQRADGLLELARGQVGQVLAEGQ